MSFEPNIVGILCHWCSYSGADSAGASRLSYAPNVRVVRVMCTSRVDPDMVLQAFTGGADGVLVAGCHPGDCHYISGNYKAAARVQMLHQTLADFGIERERLRLVWVSASEGERYATVVNEMTEAIRLLGPLAWRGPDDAPMVEAPSGSLPADGTAP